MGMFDFIKEAGEKLFGKGEAKAAQDAAVADPSTDKVDAANRAAGDAIEAYIAQMGLSATGLTVTVDGSQGKVTVFGVAPDQATREKIILCCGNVEGVDSVEDKMSVNVDDIRHHRHTVVKGDTLWAISQAAYGNGAEYNKIFEANKPMLSNPDKIYPGQKLRIPPK